MKTKSIWLMALATLMVLGFSGCQDKTKEKANKSLTIYTWSGMFPDDVLREFEEKTGYTIHYSNFDTSETMVAKLEADKKGIYDLIISDDYILQTVIEKGLAKPIDKTAIANYSNIDPTYQGLFYDVDDTYTIPHGAGVQTIIYDPSQVDIDITGYADLWDASLKDSVGTIGNYRVINGMALKVLGKSYNTENIDDIKAAGAKLKELSPNIRLIKDDNLQDDLLSGEIKAAIMYTSQVTAAKMNNPDLKVVFPKEGIGFGTMPAFIPHNAPNPDVAHEFLNFILDAEISARCFEHLGYYTTNKASIPFIDKAYIDFLTLPDTIDLNNMESIEPIGVEAEEAHSTIWTEFKSEL